MKDVECFIKQLLTARESGDARLPSVYELHWSEKSDRWKWTSSYARQSVDVRRLASRYAHQSVDVRRLASAVWRRQLHLASAVWRRQLQLPHGRPSRDVAEVPMSDEFGADADGDFWNGLTADVDP